MSSVLITKKNSVCDKIFILHQASQMMLHISFGKSQTPKFTGEIRLMGREFPSWCHLEYNNAYHLATWWEPPAGKNVMKNLPQVRMDELAIVTVDAAWGTTSGREGGMGVKGIQGEGDLKRFAGMQGSH